MERGYQTRAHNNQGNNRQYHRENDRGYDGNGAYVDGNTVRRYETVPREAPRRDPRREQEERREQERKRQARRAAKANQQRAMQMSPGYILFLSAALILTVGVCVIFLKLQAEVHHNMKQIATLESQVLELKTDNDAALKKIEGSVDLETVRDIAINQMGMRYPTQEQIIYFQVDEDDYMNQYQDIPQG